MAYYYNEEFLDSYIGKGFSLTDMFYYEESDGEWKTNVITGTEKINESIKAILSTRVGERFFMPQFGSKLYTINFQQNSYISCDLAVVYVKEALLNWEKRIVVDSVDVTMDFDSNQVLISVSYHIKNSNVQGSYVYPYNIGSDGTIDVYSYA